MIQEIIFQLKKVRLIFYQSHIIDKNKFETFKLTLD